MTDSPYAKIAVLYSVVVVMCVCFTGGMVTYGHVSDTEKTSVTVGAAANFSDSTTDDQDDATSGNTKTCAGNTGNTGCDGATESLLEPVQLSAVAPSRDASG